MTKLLLRALFFLVPFLYSIYLSAQPKTEKDCSTTCFSSEVISANKISETCTSYELKVSYTGACAHALSHFTVAVPCGTIDHVWNSENFASEIGADPTTGLTGLKIDNTSGFGEGSLQSFTVRFNVCTSADQCADQMRCWQPVVAYKASTCVNYETLEVNCQSLEASLNKIDASCFNANDGALSVVVAEGQEPFTFLWSDNSTSESLSNLGAGAYSVIVRDASGAELTLEETIEVPEKIVISGATTAASCAGVSTGAIDITVSGGQSPYSFSWNNGMQTEDLQTVSTGEYAVTVKDKNNCVATARFTVGSTSQINITGARVEPGCNAADGSIDISVTGGAAPYSFKWNDDVATEDRPEIGAGLYKVTVTDNIGCTGEASFLLQETNTLVLTASSTSATCNEELSGSLDLTVTGGTGPYTYVWRHGAVTEDLSGVAAGYYTVDVTDAKGCEASQSFSISKSTFQVPRIVQQPTCHGESNGSITLHEPIGGTAPFTYLWSLNGETGTSLTNLPAGVYSVTITDATGCTRTVSSTVRNPSEIIVTASVSNAACDVEGSFAIDLDVSGGTAPYTFDWSNGSASEDISDVASGSYTVIITDAHGCTISKEIIIEAPSPSWLCLINEPIGLPACGSPNNTLSTSIVDADSYSWTVESSDGNWTISGADSPAIAFTAGSGGSTATFTLTIIKDGCTKSCTYTASACTPEDDGEGDEPGGENPGDEDPDDDNSGEDPDGDTPGDGNPDDEDGDGNNQNCGECFETDATLVTVSGSCRTYEIEVNTNGLCRHELSHWTLAVPCGTISNYSNSKGWEMEWGQDPTTGLNGLKVDGINTFGKEAESFIVRFTVCETGTCDLAAWSPLVAYKAGQCVETESVELNEEAAGTHAVSAYPNPFNESINFEWNGQHSHVNLQIIDQYGTPLSTVTNPTGAIDDSRITLESSGLAKGMYYYRLTIDGKTYHGKISKR